MFVFRVLGSNKLSSTKDFKWFVWCMARYGKNLFFHVSTEIIVFASSCNDFVKSDIMSMRHVFGNTKMGRKVRLRIRFQVGNSCGNTKMETKSTFDFVFKGARSAVPQQVGKKFQ